MSANPEPSYRTLGRDAPSESHMLHKLLDSYEAPFKSGHINSEEMAFLHQVCEGFFFFSQINYSRSGRLRACWKINGI